MDKKAISIEISKFFEKDKIKIWPSKNKPREQLRSYLINYFPDDKILSEKEVNELLNTLHSFNDPAFLRRDLCDHGLLIRDKYGYKYWKSVIE